MCRMFCLLVGSTAQPLSDQDEGLGHDGHYAYEQLPLVLSGTEEMTPTLARSD